VSRTLYATNLEGKLFFDAEVKILAEIIKKNVYQSIFIWVALNFMPRLRMSSAFQFQNFFTCIFNF